VPIGLIVRQTTAGCRVSSPHARSAPDEILKRFGIDPEPADDLAAQAAAAEQRLGIHGVSVTARETTAPAGRAIRSDVERAFRVHDTPGRRDRLHRTVELSKPVTAEVAAEFNRLFGRA
jgi:hypothetical protein